MQVRSLALAHHEADDGASLYNRSDEHSLQTAKPLSCSFCSYYPLSLIKCGKVVHSDLLKEDPKTTKSMWRGFLVTHEVISSRLSSRKFKEERKL